LLRSGAVADNCDVVVQCHLPISSFSVNSITKR
jgi:hypothetical protein